MGKEIFRCAKKTCYGCNFYLIKLSQFSWKAGYGFHLFRPEGGGQLGGSSIAFKKN